MLIDGFANGWRLDLDSLGPAIHDGTLSVVLSWQPQKRVDVALLVSLAAIIVCLVLAFVPVRLRRRRGRHGRGRHGAGRGRHGRGRQELGRQEAGAGAARGRAGAAGAGWGSRGGSRHRGRGWDWSRGRGGRIRQGGLVR